MEHNVQQQVQQQARQQQQQPKLQSAMLQQGTFLNQAPLALSAPPPSAHPFPMVPTSTGISSASAPNAALAYANAQLAHFAATGGVLPSHMDAHALSVDIGASAPGSGASSPGGILRGLPRTGYSTPGTGLPSLERPIHTNGRVAVSAVTGKRLNWSDMICQTIAESEDGRLVIQDLFEQMCAKFPEIREWAFGKDWEARVKNRIKSTLSIKGNLFVKVPRPSSAAGKGSWWTLSPEAQEMWKAGRTASVVKNPASYASHNRSMSGASSHAAGTGGASKDHSGFNSHMHSGAGHNVGSQSAGPSSRHGSPVTGRQTIAGLAGPSNPMNNLRNAIYASGIGQQSQPLGLTPAQQTMMSYGLNPLTSANYHADGFSSPFAGTGTMTPTAGYLLEGLNMQGLDPVTSFRDESLDQQQYSAGTESDLAVQRMRLMESSVNDAFDASSASAPSAGLTSSAVGLPDLADGSLPWTPVGPGGASTAFDDLAGPSSLSPEDATTSSDSDLSNPLEHTTAALFNSLGVEGTNGSFYDGTDLGFASPALDPFGSNGGIKSDDRESGFGSSAVSPVSPADGTGHHSARDFSKGAAPAAPAAAADEVHHQPPSHQSSGHHHANPTRLTTPEGSRGSIEQATRLPWSMGPTASAARPPPPTFSGL